MSESSAVSFSSVVVRKSEVTVCVTLFSILASYLAVKKQEESPHLCYSVGYCLKITSFTILHL